MTVTKKKTQKGSGNKGCSFYEELPALRHEAARLLDAAINTHGTPDFITNAVTGAVREACRAHGLNPPDWLTKPEGDNEGDTLAALFARIPDLYNLELEPKRDLAGLISAVLKHPDIPADLYTAIHREIATMTEPAAVNEDPAVIAVALAVHKAEAEEGGGQ